MNRTLSHDKYTRLQQLYQTNFEQQLWLPQEKPHSHLMKADSMPPVELLCPLYLLRDLFCRQAASVPAVCAALLLNSVLPRPNQKPFQLLVLPTLTYGSIQSELYWCFAPVNLP